MDNSLALQPSISAAAGAAVEPLLDETLKSAHHRCADIGPYDLPFWTHSYAPRLVLVSDLDHTMVQNEDCTHHRLLTFNAMWQIHNTPSKNLLVYSTGRSPRLYRQLWEEAPLLTPAVLICSVGTEIFYLVPEHTAATGGKSDSESGRRYKYEPDAEWEALLDQGWDSQRVLQVAERFPELRRQVKSEQRRHKLSFHVISPEAPTTAPDVATTAMAAAMAAPDDVAAAAMAPPPPPQLPSQRPPSEVLRQLQEDLQHEMLRVKVVYSGGRDVDLLAEGAGKGAALLFLLDRLKRAGRKPLDGVLVCGDSGNDIELFQVPGVFGCVVSNAFVELRNFAKRQQEQGQEQELQQQQTGAPQCTTILQASEPCAGGILQALRNFKLLPSPSPSPPLYDMEHGPSLTGAMVVAHRLLLSKCSAAAATAAATVTSATVFQTTPSPAAAAAAATAAKATKSADNGSLKTFPDGFDVGEGSVRPGGGDAGDGGDSDDVAEVALVDADNVVAAATAAAGIWIDEVRVDIMKPPEEQGEAGSTRQYESAAVAHGELEWRVRCKVRRLMYGSTYGRLISTKSLYLRRRQPLNLQVYQLLPNGRRNLQRRAQLTLTHHHGSSSSGSISSGGLRDAAPPRATLPSWFPTLDSTFMGSVVVLERRVDGLLVVVEEEPHVPGDLMAVVPLPPDS
ncbi:hypothetical protein VaNZ11_011332 [Volvox africanus]|uniref:Sucrose phosphatase-like domain-containing protein n=1 Tax=Volvox africanus TaxID=51714 RepID=A0ABQ5SBG7_9CHLO|nr:hypothetical protein VaNZ11_011332 [Volvox africanus]